MRVRCSKCNKKVDRTRAAVVLNAAKGGFPSLQEYMKAYVCRSCGGMLQPTPKLETLLEQKKEQKAQVIRAQAQAPTPIDEEEVTDVASALAEEPPVDDTLKPVEEKALDLLVKKQGDEEEQDPTTGA